MLPLALKFTGTIDPAALATFVLAVVAIVGLVLTRQSLQKTQSEIDLSRREVEEAHRPVVVPSAASRPGITPGAMLQVPVSNIGMGPALQIEASAKLLEADGRPSLSSTGAQMAAMEAGLGAGEFATLEIKPHGWTMGVSFELTVIYEDVAGKRWHTVGRWVNARERYEGVNVDPLS